MCAASVLVCLQIRLLHCIHDSMPLQHTPIKHTRTHTHNNITGGGRVIEHTLRGNHPRRAAAARVARYRDIDSEEEEYDSDGDSWDEGGGRGLRRSTRGRR